MVLGIVALFWFVSNWAFSLGLGKKHRKSSYLLIYWCCTKTFSHTRPTPRSFPCGSCHGISRHAWHLPAFKVQPPRHLAADFRIKGRRFRLMTWDQRNRILLWDGLIPKILRKKLTIYIGFNYRKWHSKLDHTTGHEQLCLKIHLSQAVSAALGLAQPPHQSAFQGQQNAFLGDRQTLWIMIWCCLSQYVQYSNNFKYHNPVGFVSKPQ